MVELLLVDACFWFVCLSELGQQKIVSLDVGMARCKWYQNDTNDIPAALTKSHVMYQENGSTGLFNIATSSYVP